MVAEKRLNQLAAIGALAFPFLFELCFMHSFGYTLFGVGILFVSWVVLKITGRIQHQTVVSGGFRTLFFLCGGFLMLACFDEAPLLYVVFAFFLLITGSVVIACFWVASVLTRSDGT